MPKMTSLMITDIRKSRCDEDYDLITGVIASSNGNNAKKSLPIGNKSLLVLESATANRDIPSIGVSCGDQYIRMRANPEHGLSVGEEITIDSI
jgi:hypothetical protein